MSIITSTSSSTAAPINVFDFEAIRLPPNFEREAGVRKQLTLVRVRQPRKQEWVRVHPEHRAEVATIVFKENEEAKPEIYLVAPGRRDATGRRNYLSDDLPRNQSAR